MTPDGVPACSSLSKSDCFFLGCAGTSSPAAIARGGGAAGVCEGRDAGAAPREPLPPPPTAIALRAFSSCKMELPSAAEERVGEVDGSSAKGLLCTAADAAADDAGEAWASSFANGLRLLSEGADEGDANGLLATRAVDGAGLLADRAGPSANGLLGLREGCADALRDAVAVPRVDATGGAVSGDGCESCLKMGGEVAG